MSWERSWQPSGLYVITSEAALLLPKQTLATKSVSEYYQMLPEGSVCDALTVVSITTAEH